jgi:ankyrin repeat protein
MTGGDLKERKHSIIAGALRNDFSEVRAALAEDPDCINDRDPRMGVTALHITAGNGSFPLVKFLCEQPGCDPFLLDQAGRSAAFMAVVVGRVDISNRIGELQGRLALGEDYDDLEPLEEGDGSPAFVPGLKSPRP